MICASCQTPAGPEQSFCRSCGSRLHAAEPARDVAEPVGVACPNCEHDNAPGGRFCRACGTALSPSGEQARPSRVMALATDDETTIVRHGPPKELKRDEPTLASSPFSQDLTEPVAAAGPPCHMCGAPAGGRDFCVDCDPRADTLEQTVPLARAPAPRLTRAYADRPAEPGRRRMRVVVIAVALVLLAAAAVTAVVALAMDDNSQPARPAGAARPDAPTAQAPADEPGPVAAPATTASGAAAQAATGAEKALREHWQAAGDGDFPAAYDRFSSKYRKSHDLADWSDGMRGFSPRYEIVEVEQIESAGDRAIVRVTLVTRDRGARGEASRCHIFRGRVRVLRERGRWSYDPPGLRETPKGGIDPSSDDRCEPLFR